MNNNIGRAHRGAWMGLLVGASLALVAGAASAQSTPPANDDFENAQPLRSANGGYLTSGYWYGNTSQATDEDGEPTHAGNFGGKSVWFYWVAPYSGSVSFTTAGSRFDTLLACYRGDSLDTLSRVASNDNVSSSDYTSAIRFNAVAGASYLLAVDGFNPDDLNNADPQDAEAGYYRLNVFFSNSNGGGTRPSNDNFASAYNLGSTTTRTVRGSSFNATREYGEPYHAGQSGGRSVWFRWTAPYTGYVQLSSGGSNFPTLLAAYYGSSLPALRVYGSGRSNARFYAVQGYTYRIALDGFNGASGNYVLSLTQDSNPDA